MVLQTFKCKTMWGEITEYRRKYFGNYGVALPVLDGSCTELGLMI